MTAQTDNEAMRDLINEALELPEYSRKQIILALSASMLGNMALADVMAIADVIRNRADAQSDFPTLEGVN